MLWHTTFPAAILVYALSKDMTAVATLPGRSTMTSIVITIACVLAVIAGLTWIVTAKTEYLPSFYTTDVTIQTRFGNQINLALWLWGSTALAVLFVRRRTILDLWLMVTLARLDAKLLGGDHRQFGTIYRRLVCGSLLRSDRQLHVAERVAHRNDVSLFTPCQRDHFAATRTHQPALERGGCHGRHRP